MIGLYQMRAVEYFFSFPNDDSVTGKRISSESISKLPDLFAADFHPILLDQTTCLPLGDSQSAPDHQVQNVDGAVGEIGFRQFC